MKIGQQMSEAEKLVISCRKNSPAFKSMATVLTISRRLGASVLSLVAAHLPKRCGLSETETQSVIDFLGRPERENQSWSAAEMAVILRSEILPFLESKQASQQTQGDKGVVTRQRKPRPDRKLPLGFTVTTPAVPVILVGQPTAVRAAIQFVAREHAVLSRLLYLSGEQTNDQDVWQRQDGNFFTILAPRWVSLLYGKETLSVMASRFEEKMDGEPFDLLLVDDLATDPPATSRSASARYVTRAEEACRRLMKWSKRRGTVLVGGLHRRENETHRDVELKRLSDVSSVYEVHADGGYLYATDSDGNEHQLGD